MHEATSRQRWDLTLRLLSPMQIGAGTLGMIEKTELFIPGRVLWGALTNVLTCRLVPRPKAADFQEIGEALGRNGTCIATFFPSLDGGNSVWRPRFDKNEREWINNSRKAKQRSEREMRRDLTCSVASNATDPSRLATYAESLHATDMIAPVFRDRAGRLYPTCFRGMLDLPKTLRAGGRDTPLDANTIATALDNARLGGGRKRGWGRIKVVNLNAVDNRDNLHAVPLNSGKGTWLWLLTPDCAIEKEHAQARGRAFLAVYRQYDNANRKGYGRAHTTARLCWEVGTLLPGPAAGS